MTGEAPPPRVTVNTDEYMLRQLARAREATLSGMFGALDNKRPRAWEQYGYPEEVTFTALLKAYERGGPAQGAVHRILDACWQERPRIKQPGADEETQWEKKVGSLFKAVGAWRKLRDFDRRNMVGRYAALVYRVADGLQLREPMGRAQKLVDIVPLYESQMTPTMWDTDQASPRYGQPVMYQMRARRPEQIGQTGQAGQPDLQVEVHWTRVQILAEGSVGDMFDGVPLLKAGFNHLVDLEKVSGGSAESFLKNSARTVTLEFEAQANVGAIAATPGETTPTGSALATAINDKVKDLNRNTDAALVLQGGKANTLQTTVSDPEPSFTVAANMFSASVRIPFTILFGQQTGRLASDEDRKDFAARCGSRQQNELTPMLEEFVRRMQAAGLIEEGDFEIEWPALDAPTEDDKASLLGKMTAAMQQAAQAGLSQPLFDANELRGVMDFEERTDDGLPEEGEPTAEEMAAAAAAQAAGQPPPARPTLRAAA